MTFGAFVKEKRGGKNLSLREVAARIGVDPAYLSRVEGGKVRPSEHLIAQLAPILGCSADDLALMAGQLPQRVRSALERSGAAPADAVRELTTLYATEAPKVPQFPKTNAKRRGRTAKTVSTPGKLLAALQPTLSLFEPGEEPSTAFGAGSGEHTGATARHKIAMVERKVDPRNALNDLTSTEWIPETISVWTQRGLGAGHADAQIERQHPAPFSFTDVARLIRFFSKPGDLVLDPFSGIGSTLKACALEGRRGVGIELNPRYAQLTRERLKREVMMDKGPITEQDILEGDARLVLQTLDDDSVDFIVTSPPYWNILHKEDHKAKQERKERDLDTRYSDDPRDLGNVKDYEAFLGELTSILAQCGQVLKRKKYLAIIVSDFRDKSKFIMFHADLAHALEQHNFGLRGIKVLYQRHKRIFPYGYPYAYVPNIHHQYILILQNER
jgi:DNA modification methylase/transcriptional regulator with XRE-family HTH domain